MDPDDRKFNRYLPFVIYQNIQKLLEYRKLDLVEGVSYETKKIKKHLNKFVDHDEFVKDIQYHGYILIEAKDKPEKERRFAASISAINKKREVKTFIILYDLNSIHTKSSGDFVKSLNKIPGFDSVDRDYNMDILIINHEELNLHLMKKVDFYTTEGTASNGFIHLFPYQYKHFSSDRMKHVLIPPHEIIPKEIEKKTMSELRNEKRDLPRIRKVDAVAIWLGADTGEIIMAKMNSEAAGIETKYLLVR